MAHSSGLFSVESVARGFPHPLQLVHKSIGLDSSSITSDDEGRESPDFRVSIESSSVGLYDAPRSLNAPRSVHRCSSSLVHTVLLLEEAWKANYSSFGQDSDLGWTRRSDPPVTRRSTRAPHAIMLARNSGMPRDPRNREIPRSKVPKDPGLEGRNLVGQDERSPRWEFPMSYYIS